MNWPTHPARFARSLALATLANARWVLVGCDGYGARADNYTRSALRPCAMICAALSSIRDAIMGGHNALYGGPRMLVGCSLARHRRAPAPLRRASVPGGAPLCAPSPPLLLPSRRLVAPPPVPPSVICLSCLVCSGVKVSMCVHRVCAVGGGVRGPSVCLRPRLCRADAACRPMCPAPRLRPATACVRGRGARVGPLLGSLRSLRFKWALLRAPAHPRLALACCAHLQAHFGARFCHICVTKP